MFRACSYISVLLLIMCNILELSGLFVCLTDLSSFSLPGGTEKIAGLWIARGISSLADTVDCHKQIKSKLEDENKTKHIFYVCLTSLPNKT